MVSLLLLPYIVTAEELVDVIDHPEIVIVEVGKLSDYQNEHIPNAIHVDIKQLKRVATPPSGLLPRQSDLGHILGDLGITKDKHVIAYDHGDGSAASRLLWTLEYTQHNKLSLLDGGIKAWKAQSYATEKRSNVASHSAYKYQPNNSVLADKDSVLDSINDPNTIIIDSRSLKEFTGEKSASKRRGHIPTAIHFHYQDSIDPNTNKLLAKTQLNTLLNNKNITKDKKIIVYCQTHQRAAHLFVTLRYLGYDNVLGYAGSWSEWGNDPQLPISR